MSRILEWKHLTKRDFDRLDRTRTVVTVTCSPMEVHGPHLPVVTDTLEAEGLLQRSCQRVGERHPEITFVHLPPIYVAADVLPHHGSLMFRSSTIVRVVEDLGRSLAKQGFLDVWISNFHGGPRHFVPIEVACDRVNRRFGARMVSAFSLLITRLTGGSTDLSDVLARATGLSRTELAGDAHGGVIETSMMLHLLGDEAHRVGAFADLPPRTPDLVLAAQGKAPKVGGPHPSLRRLVTGLFAKLKYYEHETYSGRPALGRAELGEAILEELSSLTADALSDVWTRKLPPEAARSPLWTLRWILCSDAATKWLERALRYQNRVFLPLPGGRAVALGRRCVVASGMHDESEERRLRRRVGRRLPSLEGALRGLRVPAPWARRAAWDGRGTRRAEWPAGASRWVHLDHPPARA